MSDAPQIPKRITKAWLLEMAKTHGVSASGVLGSTLGAQIRLRFGAVKVEVSARMFEWLGRQIQKGGGI